MFVDARKLPNGHLLEADVCVIGAGAAGITIARELAGQRFQVCLVESGGFEFDSETQTLYEGGNVGLPYFPLSSARLRYFGGSTNHWNNWCRPLDPLDFEHRSWVSHSGWPFPRSHLDPFYERAQAVCGLGSYNYDSGYWANVSGYPRLPFDPHRVVTHIFQFQFPPVRFGSTYKDDIARAKNTQTLLHANVIELETNDSGRAVARARVATMGGGSSVIKARLFVLATGGIENPRLLLGSRKVQKNGLGNQHDLVGRFFMEHPHMDVGVIVPTPDNKVPINLYLRNAVREAKVRGVLSLSEEVLRKENLAGASFEVVPIEDPLKGRRSAEELVSALRQRRLPEGTGRHLLNILGDYDELFNEAYKRLLKAERGPFRVEHPLAEAKLFARSEQTPNPESRVTLSRERDALGQQRVQLDWRINHLDKESLARALQIIAIECGRLGLGRIRVDIDATTKDWPSELHGGFHHMGTTRMHPDPKHGVVDADCKVHGIGNLFIAGSSVFPTCGFSNPTLTIVALGIRLADHVKRLMHEELA